MAAPTIVPLTRTGGSGTGADRDAWIRTRHAALVAELRRRGYGNAWTLAMAPVAHWGSEVGWGHGEFDYAIGNVRSVGQCPLAHMLQGADDPVPRPYCAHRSLDEGVARTLDLILAPRYLPAWQYLTATGDAPGWYERLLRPPQGGDGWHPYSAAAVNDYRSQYARVARTVGAEPASSGGWLYVAAGALLLGAAALIASDRR